MREVNNMENMNLALIAFVCFTLASQNVINIGLIRKNEIHAKIGSQESITVLNDSI